MILANDLSADLQPGSAETDLLYRFDALRLSPRHVTLEHVEGFALVISLHVRWLFREHRPSGFRDVDRRKNRQPSLRVGGQPDRAPQRFLVGRSQLEFRRMLGVRQFDSYENVAEVLHESRPPHPVSGRVIMLDRGRGGQLARKTPTPRFRITSRRLISFTMSPEL